MTMESAQKSTIAKAKAVKSRPSRKEQLTKLLSRKACVTIGQIQKAFGWQTHSARATISTLRKSGISVESSDAQKGAVYHNFALV
jgi:predicted ArsR family transcriptional regulator